MTDLPDFSIYCEAACIALWGEPDRRNFKELRWGSRDGYSGRTYNIKKRRWYDRDAKCGGGALQLIALEQGWLNADGKPDVKGKRFFEAWRIGYEKKIFAEPPPGPKTPVNAPIRAVFQYRDEQGRHVYDVVRFDTEIKDDRFRYRLPSGEWKLGKTPRVLYRLPELKATIASGQRVLCCEGEKDCESAVKLGYAATTNPEGVDKWRAEFDTHFTGADVVIVGDNDAPGHAFAEKKRKRLIKVASHVSVVFPPESYKDLNEWIAAGGTREQLDALIEAEPSSEPEPEPPPPDEDAELERLARLSEWDFERSRVEAAKQLGVTASFLKTARKLKRAELGLDGNNGQQGRRYEFPSIEPWPKPVDGAQVLDEISSVIRRHVVMPEHAAEAIALWVVHTHLFDRFLISPRLALRSVTKQCGKTTTLDILARWVRRPLPTVNTSAAALFRIIESDQPTFLVDEADTFLKDNEELRGIINSGHRQGGCVLRVEGDAHEARAFATFAPCAIAAIGSLPGTIMDRSVVIDLARRKPNEKIESFRLDRTAELDELARRIARWADDNADVIGALDPDIPPGLYNRVADNWRPLFQIADLAGGDWPQRARAAALAGAPDVDEVSLLELLLGDIRDIFDALPSDLVDKAHRISSAEMIEKLCEIQPRPWSEFGKPPKEITQNKLAHLLKPLGIAPVLMRISTEDGTEERARGYARHQFVEAFERYLPSEGDSNRDSVTNADMTGTSGTSGTVTAENVVTVPKSEKSNSDGVCHGVTVAKGESGWAPRAAPDVGLSLTTFRTLINTYDDMVFEAESAAAIEHLHGSFRKRLADHGLAAAEIEIALDYIVEQAPQRRNR